MSPRRFPPPWSGPAKSAPTAHSNVKLCCRSHFSREACLKILTSKSAAGGNHEYHQSDVPGVSAYDHVHEEGNIDPAVRAKLEELGVDTVRSKLVWTMNDSDLAQQDEPQPLGVGLSASRRQMQDWLTEKAARETLWVRVGVIAAVLAALFSLLSWYAPLIKISISQVS